MKSPEDASPTRVLFLNRSYWPDAEATGQLLTELCEDLAPTFDVTVVAGQPNQNPGHAKFQTRGCEMRHGVRIRRVWNTRFPKSVLAGRIANLLSYLGTSFLAALALPRPDVVVVESDPPLLCLLGEFLRRWHQTKLVVYLQDIHPDIGIALGKIPDCWLTRRLRQGMFGVYRRADRVVVLSRDMRDLLIASGVSSARIDCIPNWIDTQTILPRKDSNAFRRRHGLDGQFIVMYSGNLGLCQRLEDVLAAADRLRDRPDILFLLVGDGVSKRGLEGEARRLGLPNVRFLPYQSKDDLAESLGAADLQLVPLDPRVASCLMPSKLYGVLASGNPVLAVAPKRSELAEITQERRVGLVVPPNRPDALAEAIARGSTNREELREMGRAARRLAEEQYDRRRITRRFADMLRDVVGGETLRREEPCSPATEGVAANKVRGKTRRKSRFIGQPVS